MVRPPPRSALWVAVLAAVPTSAREVWAEGEAALSLRTSLKASAVLSRAPDDPLLFRERNGGASLWRLRLEAEARPGPLASAVLAYEHRLRVESGGAAIATLGGALPAEAPAPYRIRQLEWPLARGTGLSWRHEIDRAAVALHLARAHVTVGRQAVGWGRGVLFGAVDLFAPFSPLEADREWRRGVDAVRAEVELADRTSLDGVAAFGETLDGSVLAARLRGYAGRVDGELVLGRRAGDLVAGASTSAAVGDAELHGELALFRARTALPAGGELGDDRVALKAVAGGSYRFPVGRGLVVFAEYHHSGLGVRAAGDALALLADPAFRARYLRGDSQILGRHALALLASLELGNEVTAQALWLQSPSDGSGVVSPSAVVTLSDGVSVQANAYLPFGAGPAGPALRSEYGATPLSVFVQVRIYD